MENTPMAAIIPWIKEDDVGAGGQSSQPQHITATDLQVSIFGLSSAVSSIAMSEVGDVCWWWYNVQFSLQLLNKLKSPCLHRPKPRNMQAWANKWQKTCVPWKFKAMTPPKTVSNHLPLTFNDIPTRHSSTSTSYRSPVTRNSDSKTKETPWFQKQVRDWDPYGDQHTSWYLKGFPSYIRNNSWNILHLNGWGYLQHHSRSLTAFKTERNKHYH